MACETHLEGLQNFAKQLVEQKTALSSRIQSLDAELKQAQNSYMKVEGAQEIIAIQIKEEEESKTTTAEVVPEVGGD